MARQIIDPTLIPAVAERTCFATPLERLVRHREHVRSPASLELLSEEQALSAPQEVMRVVNWLMTNAAEIVRIAVVVQIL